MIALRRTRRGERGAVAVEAALVIGVILTMIFGIVEMAFVMRDHVGVTSAARVGARAASTGAAAGPCVAELADAVPCPATGVPELAQLAADAITSARTVLPRDAISHIVVYKATQDAEPPSLVACTSECVAYRWSAGQNRFRYAQGAWDSSLVNGCADGPTPLDAVGVQIVFAHDFLTGIFGASMDMSDHAVLSFEPLANVSCAPGAHQ